MKKPEAEPEVSNLVHDTGKSIVDEQFLFSCRGSFNTGIIDNILFLTESNLLRLDTNKVAKKVYYLLVEGLQNITRHQPKGDNLNPYSGGFFIIQRKQEAYSITYGNPVSSETKGQLIERLEEIRCKTPSELKEYYMDLLNNSGFSTKGGAGLGLVDMARKSSGNLNYEFVPLPNGEYFYYLNLTIAIDPEDFFKVDHSAYIKEAIAFHQRMLDEESILMFKGLLNEENIEYLSIQIDSALASKDEDSQGLSLVMNELLRNMAKHAYNRFNQVGKPGVFMLRQQPDGYEMLTGNYINERKKKGLIRSLEAVNSLSTAELTGYIEDSLSMQDNKPAGNGLVRLRKITGHSFGHEFIEQMDETPFFILKIQVNQ